MFRKIALETIIGWLPFAAVITIVFGTIYVAVQQNYRISAYDPQIQLAENTADGLNNGKNLLSLVPQNKVDLSKNIAPFVIIYDEAGKETYSTAVLNGKTPPLPDGVLADVKKKTELRFTWQPQENVREAVIVTHYNSGFVLVGRSMREIENRIISLGLHVGFGLLASLCSSLFLIFLFTVLRLRKII